MIPYLWRRIENRLFRAPKGAGSLLATALWSSALCAGAAPSGAPSTAALSLASAGPGIAPGRPGLTNGCETVALGHTQIEDGAAVTWADGSDTAESPELLTRYGLSNRLELRVGLPDYVSGGAGRPGVAASVTLSAPSQTGGRTDTAAPSVSASYQMTPAWATHGEVSDSFPRSGSSSPICGGGVTFLAKPTWRTRTYSSTPRSPRSGSRSAGTLPRHRPEAIRTIGGRKWIILWLTPSWKKTWTARSRTVRS